MELKIYSPQDEGFLKKIEWNFEELKAEVSAASQEYAVSVYTDDTIKQAKTDRAKLNKFVDALNSKRTEIRRQLLKPDEQFGKEVKELAGIVQKAIDNIDGQIKDYERRQKEEKTAKIRDFYDANIHDDIEKYLPFERVMKPEYANASTSMKSIREEILALIQKVYEGLAILNDVDSKYVGDMKQVFLRTYDIGAAISERNRLEKEEEKRRVFEEDRARQKAECEARMKAEAEHVMAAGRSAAPMPSPAAIPIPKEQPAIETVEDPVNVVDFRVYATRDQLMRLKEFLKNNGIRFEPVPKQ
ncbi:DUF1351 domain-containing protein [Lacrimispora sp. 210928-DFI.3.58]|uniref:DUF1351 domain-containing protein n=1 Tax=Lacrimispora sp. 210928-DFI.3.58 TaxID=2883214 RepID=UPI001D08AD8A|nr:DUF1351 domain-containing protein [Lacrimispora sp. 210928-DFI.3.58]MCB7321266.1 DUF1351 domain-containing protein [Lacrimispora sp. 210928-DFI.3.58]